MSLTPEQKRARLAELLRERERARARRAPVSFAQEGLWLQERLGFGGAAFNIPTAVRFTGALDEEALRRGLAEVVRRHETLRTTFIEQEGQPHQLIAPSAEPALQVVDLEHLPGAGREEAAWSALHDEARRPFDVEREPLLRAVLYRLGPTEHLLLLNLHHLVSDAWSLGVLVRELGVLYPAFAAGRAAPLPDLPMQYAEYAAWQRDWLQGETLDSRLAWWRERLDANAVLELPTDRPRTATASTRGARRTVMLPLPLLHSLGALARSEGRTLFSVLMAAYGVLLSRYSGQRDVVVGTPVAGRTRAGLEGLIGLFVNALPLRMDLSGDPTFLELLGQVHETALGAMAHQDLPFETLVEALRPERRAGSTPVFQVTFTLQNAPLPPLELPGLVMEARPVDTGASQQDLSLLVTELDEGLRVAVVYRTDLFESERVTRLLGHLQTLLEGLAAAPGTRLSELSLLSPGERRQVLVEWSGHAAPFPDGACIHELFDAQVRRTPDAVALMHGEQSLSYAELETRANQLAWLLRARGVGAELRVALCLERSVELMVAVLAILKAGGAFVPMDPAYPAERLAFMLGDCGAPLLLTSSALDVLPPPGMLVMELDTLEALLERQPTHAPAPLATADNVAYVIYTSGSTGQPKGVMVPHRGVPNLALSQVEPQGLGPGTRVLQFASPSFDAFVWETFLTLLSGSTLCLASGEALQPGPALAELLKAQDVHVIAMSPTALGALPAEGLEGLRTVISAGEACPAELVSKWAPGRRFFNAYGPTEATVCATMVPCVPDGTPPPLGRPLPNVRVYVLDEALRPVPVGVPGELFLGGVGVARGYLDRPALTAERFVPDAFSAVPGARLYRTGDRACWRADGQLEFLGRTDTQVKLRGFRIELGEVEAALRASPDVSDAVAVVREDGSTGPLLVAYVAPVQGVEAASLDTRALRNALSERLPEHMVPSAVVALPALPLNPNGKVDRKALPAPDAASTAASQHVAPSTPTELLLADIWAQVLGVSRVGTGDNFFELGGHSLMATQVVSRLRTVFRLELPVRELFAAPTLGALARQVDTALRATRGLVLPPLLPVPRTGELPLSFAQQRLWFIDQLEPGSPLYNMPAALRLEGSLDAQALEAALAEVVRRHEALRTTFVSHEGQPVQHIHPDGGFRLSRVELTALPPAQRQDEARRLAREEAQRPFDLAAGPLLRALLLRLDEDEHVLLLSLHHIVTDGWSTGNLVREVAALYTAFTSGQPSPLSPLPVQYADYAVWQRGWLQGEVLEHQLSWWRQRLEGAPHALELPTDRPRPAVQTSRGAYLPVRLPLELSESLKALSRRQGLTPFMTLLAAFQVLLHRYSGQDDLIVGSPIAGRNHSDTEGLIGFFVNNLALRARIDPRAPFLSLLEQVRETTLAAYEHQDVPFAKLVEELRPQRSLSHAPLYQTSFSLLNTPMAALELPGLRLHPLAPDSLPARFDLNLALEETPAGFSGSLHYATDLFDASTIERMWGHLRTLLAAISEDATRPVALLPLLSPEEQRQLLVEWSGHAVPFPDGACIHELFDAQARRTPDAVALVHGEQSLSYAELETRANQLAHELRANGVRAETRVALCLERSAELVVAVLATLKAGGAFVPMDPAYPSERLAFMLGDCAAPLLLTSSTLDVPAPYGVLVLELDTLAPHLARQPTHAPATLATADNVAYVIYTSGSTGQPKGVMVPHRGVPNLALSQVEPQGLGPGTRVLQFASPGFDAFAWETFPTLLSGATLCMASGEALQPGPALAELLKARDVHVIAMTPTSLAALPAEGLDGLRTVISGGEACPPELVTKWAPGRRFLNVYGPTEATVCAAMAPCVPDGTPPLLGRPLPNVRVYVLDESLQPVPVGVPGELFLGGVGVARGYLDRPALTAERFVPDAFSAVPGARLYRTGDRVRFRADGQLEFLGRTDTQVKLRGFRIELGEVEAALRTSPDVSDAVAVVREDSPTGPRLVAYVVSAQGVEAAGLDTRALRDALSARLPEHMVPSAVVALPALPLSPNGKVDRKALPAPDVTTTPAEHLAPSTPTELLLADIWAQVLGVARVGTGDNFFELGGHSLLATQVVSRMRSVFGTELAVREFFSSPTLGELARQVDAALRAAQGLTLPPLVPVPRTGELPLSFTQQRLWFIDQLEPGTATYNMPTALRLEGMLDAQALQAALAEVVRRHEALRTTFASREGQPTQFIHPDSDFRLSQVDLEPLPADERQDEARRLAREEALRPFDLANGPLLRALLLRLAEDEHVLLLTLHHIVSDGWSMGVLVQEVAALYTAFSSGKPSPLPPLPLQYADYSAWQRGWLQGDVLDSQRSWWRHHLSGAPHTLELPTDKPRPAVLSSRGASVPLLLPAPLADALDALCRREAVTPFMALLSAFQLLLGRYSGQSDFLVASPVAGRDAAELEPLIGFFVGTLPLRARLSPSDSFRALLAHTRHSSLEAFAHQSLPFERIVEALEPQRDLSRPPLVQVLFALQNAPLPPLDLPGLSLHPLEGLGSGIIKLELELYLWRSPEGYAGQLAYNTDLFERTTVERLGAHLRTLVEALVARPEAPLSSVSLLTGAERQRMLVDWNATATDYPRGSTLPEVFAQAAARYPDHVAVESGGAKLTYRQLDARANQLAHHLRGLGVSTDARVALGLERSLEFVVSLLAVLKAGGAYVPLDPWLPPARLASMVEDARPRVLLTTRALLPGLSGLGLATVVLDDAPLSALPTSAPPATALPGSLAYVIFTSGSTGRPKGVAVEHQSVLRTVLGVDYLHFGPDESLLQVAPISFDVSVMELWGALLHGARLVLLPPHTPSLEELATLLRRERITTCWLPSGLFSQMVESEFDSLRTVQQLIAGGDVVSALHARKVLEGLSASLTNGYGPTEATVFAVCHRMTSPARLSASVPIGRPIGNTRVYVLDDSGQPVPVGVTGELFIGGDGVARGYLEQPALTAERFVPDAFSGVPGARLYRTGDRVRWSEDGVLDYLGRADSQVKVRGFRIELGEVEATLLVHPQVREAVALVREDMPGDKRLVAYVVLASAQAEAPRAFLQQRLPEYMVPSAVVVLPALPLTANGKVDRKALPAPDAPASSAGYLAPSTPTELLLADIWTQVLGVSRVGTGDNFFELGGHSLLATRVVSRIRAVFGTELPLRELFSSPTLGELARQVDTARQPAPDRKLPPLVPVPRTGEPPLSFAQQRLWFIDQLEPGSPLYNLPFALRLEGTLDAQALQAALAEVVCRHEALRTTFASREGQPVQCIHPDADFPLSQVDLEPLPADERQHEARRLAREEALRPFDLANGPLLRALLLRLAEDEHVLLLTLHHIVSDGWSMGVLVQEVAALYTAFSSGKPSPLPPLPLQYADYSAWQRGWLQGDVLDSQRSWWRHHLSGAPHTLELPTDKPRPAVLSSRGASVPLLLPAPLADALDALCRREAVTPFMALLSAFQLLLGRYSGQSDFLLASPVAGRDAAELESLIGFFVGTLPLRARLSPSDSFRALLSHTRHSSLEAFAHQSLPFERIVEALEPQRDLSRPPLVQVLFALQNAPLPPLDLTGLSLRPLDAAQGAVTRFELELSIVRTAEGYAGQLTYNTDLFEPATALRLAEHFRTVTEALVTHPEAPLSSVSLLTGAERQRMLVDWNATATDYPRGSTLPEVFAQVVARTPDQVAVEFADELGASKLTYRQLDARANQLAHHLRGLGVSTDARVALAVDRSLELVVALVAILKAGGAYVPLDSSYPRERLAAMVEDARPCVLVTTRELLAKLPADGLPAVVLGEVSLEGQPTSAPLSTALPDSLAYIDFTSGSTGRPKGVGTPHAAVLRTVLGVDYAHLGPEETFLLIAPVSFDASTLELWGPLLHGARLVVFPPHSPSDLKELEAVLVKHGVTTLHLTAGLFTQVVDHDLRALRGVRQLLTGGDVVSAPHVRRVLEGMLIPVTACYGPTETTLFASYHRMTSVEQVGTSVPIGRPIGNTRVYVLDDSGQPVPVGVTGELLIGGDGVARGYVEQPALTAERFVPDAHSGVPGARLYRTGDLVRWRGDGVLEFLGRADAQVKVRGYRIELAEVEAALLAHPEVREAVALAREDVPGDKRLVGYVVPASGDGASPLDTAHLRDFLTRRLPGYMVPSSLVVLPALPLTPQGKVDRKALPTPGAVRALADEAHVAPRTRTEQVLAELMATLLLVPRVGLHDNFFALGGHSLLATRLVSRIRSAFAVELPLRALFEQPTLEALARRIDEAQGSAPRRQAPVPVPVPRAGPLPLSFAQQRLWFIDQLEPGGTPYNIPVALRLEGPLDGDALQRGLSELFHRHEALRTTFVQEEGQPLQRISPPAGLPLHEVDLSGLESDAALQELHRQVREEVARPFDLAAGPLMRARLWRLGPTEHVLMLNLHHIVSDGWSMGVLVREMAALYEAFARGAPSPLPPLPLQYADYAVWQRQWLQGEVLEEQLDWWRQQLSGLPKLELPTDRPHPPVQTFRGAELTFRLSQPVSEAVQSLCQQEGLTPFMLLLAAWQVLLSRYSGQRDVAVGTPIAGRQHADLEGLIGFFINTLVLRARVDASGSFLSLLRQVRETALGAYAHQDVPFERLVEELHPERDLSRPPLFQVIFAMQNSPMATLTGQGLALRPVELDTPTVRFELELSLRDAPGGYQGALVYNTDLFDAATAARMTEHFRTLVEALVARPEAPLSSVSMLTEAERQRMLVDWNATAADYPRDSTLPDIFAQVAARYPDKVAVEAGDAHLTYRQLDERANQLAWHLKSLGVSTDARVALGLERSLELVVAVLALLKAGGAYVPLDVNYPPARLAGMVEDARPRALITTRALLPRMPAEGLPTVVLDDAVLSHLPTTAPPSTALPGSLAFIVFTSGSTGRPKGVALQHRSVLRTIFGIDHLHYGPDETLLQVAPTSFDVFTSELWGSLLHGGRLVLLPPHTPSLEELASLLRDKRITTTWLPSGLFSQMVESEFDSLRTVRQIIAGGDVVPAPHARRVLEGLSATLTNGYGPTETAVFAVCYRMTDAAQVGASVPIGRPISNTCVYVLDDSGQPVPVGVTGELFIGGDGVARGYVEQPALTAERFVPDALSGIPGARLYRTGDRVRWRDDGILEYLGRADTQVKVRGFRIELGEVEAALLAWPQVRDTIALVREDVPGDKRLVAYVVPAPASEGAALDLEHLRAFLQQRLPGFMVPAALVALPVLPLTANGKVDRRALPAPDAPAPGTEYVAPRTPLETRLTETFASVLRVPRVGLTDDFFALGGHSLLAVRLVARVRDSTGLSIPISAIFQSATVERLVRWLEQRRDGASTPPNLTRMNAGAPGRRPFFLFHGGGGGVGRFSELARLLGPDRPVYGVHASGMDGGEPPHDSVEALADQYLRQVRAVQPRGPYVLGGWSFGGLVAHELARRLQDAGEQVELLALLDSVAPGSRPAPEPDTLADLAGFGRLLGLSWEGLTLDVDLLRRVEAREALAHVLEQARRSPSGAPDLDLDAAERLFRVYQRLDHALRTYVPARAFQGPAIVLRAAIPPAGPAPAKDLGWSAWLPGTLTVYEVPGDHYTLLSAPHVPHVAERLAHHLDSLERDVS
ncbi:non-ribosomal peptide synthetase [Pyxidicoccus trucidator]|uniref:non-ribosomal peptide synthetase n=1 Tax=Pyxidicoccus trucidator TaxID=2709662 RepID=UPI0013DBDD92|nr:non-ribosomal peptide synthetase [Pyxidicoccus trucidator]